MARAIGSCLLLLLLVATPALSSTGLNIQGSGFLQASDDQTRYPIAQDVYITNDDSISSTFYTTDSDPSTTAFMDTDREFAVTFASQLTDFSLSTDSPIYVKMTASQLDALVAGTTSYPITFPLYLEWTVDNSGTPPTFVIDPAVVHPSFPNTGPSYPTVTFAPDQASPTPFFPFSLDLKDVMADCTTCDGTTSAPLQLPEGQVSVHYHTWADYSVALQYNGTLYGLAPSYNTTVVAPYRWLMNYDFPAQFIELDFLFYVDTGSDSVGDDGQALYDAVDLVYPSAIHLGTSTVGTELFQADGGQSTSTIIDDGTHYLVTVRDGLTVLPTQSYAFCDGDATAFLSSNAYSFPVHVSVSYSTLLDLFAVLSASGDPSVVETLDYTATGTLNLLPFYASGHQTELQTTGETTLVTSSPLHLRVDVIRSFNWTYPDTRMGTNDTFYERVIAMRVLTNMIVMNTIQLTCAATLPTTPAPTTLAPTTLAPTTLAPTTLAPTTAAPTTAAPTTEVPTTEVPTTEVPTTTAAPTAESPGSASSGSGSQGNAGLTPGAAAGIAAASTAVGMGALGALLWARFRPSGAASLYRV